MKSIVISSLISMAILFALAPLAVFAAGEDAGQDSSVEAVQPVADGASVQPAAGSAFVQPAADGASVNPAASTAPVSDIYSIELTQTELNERNVTVTLEELDTIISRASSDSVRIDAKMTYNGTVTASTSKVLQISDFDAVQKTAEFELPFFGKYCIDVFFLKDGSVVNEKRSMVVGVAAEEYNIAGFIATTDSLIFSLRFFIDGEIRHFTDKGDEIPTIVSLGRPKQYDWDSLPEGMYRDPLLTTSENLSNMAWDDMQGSDNKMDRMRQYVKELNEIHPGSVFHFYINDYHIYSFPKVSFANGLEDDQYTLTMLTDGSGTYTSFKEAYDNVEDAESKHDQLKSEYLTFKNRARSGSISNFNNLPSGSLRHYLYAIVEVENADWWVVRKSADTFGIQDQTFQSMVLGDVRITNSYINDLLSNVQTAGKDAAFRALHKFDDEAFRATRAKNKKIMMILGTNKEIEDKYNVTDYVRFMVYTMGDEYDFYYKGHPGNYLANSEENVIRFQSMGIQMLDPSIAAELFQFYNDDIYLCGYESSLFNNVSNEKSEEQDIALFRRTLETAKADYSTGGYADHMDFMISDLTSTDDKYTYQYDEIWDSLRSGMKEAKDRSNEIRRKMIALIPAEEKGARNYLVQYNNNENKTVSEYDCAIWNSDRSIVHYVKEKENGSLEIVKTDYFARVEAKPTIRLSQTDIPYSGKVSHPKVSVSVRGNKLAADLYDVKYSSGGKNIGTYKVTVTLKGNYKGSASMFFRIVPAKAAVSKVKPARKKVTVKVKAQKGGVKYQIAVRQKAAKKKWKICTAAKTTRTISKLKSRKKYQIRVRAFRKVSGKTYYGSWSKIKTVRTK